MSAAAEVLADPDLLESILQQLTLLSVNARRGFLFAERKRVLEEWLIPKRSVSKLWRAAAAKPLMIAGLLLDRALHSHVDLGHYFEAVRARTNCETVQPIAALTAKEVHAAQWAVQSYGVGVPTIFAGDVPGLNGRRAAIAAMACIASMGCVTTSECSRFSIVLAPRSALVGWHADLRLFADVLCCHDLSAYKRAEPVAEREEWLGKMEVVLAPLDRVGELREMVKMLMNMNGRGHDRKFQWAVVDDGGVCGGSWHVIGVLDKLVDRKDGLELRDDHHLSLVMITKAPCPSCFPTLLEASRPLLRTAFPSGMIRMRLLTDGMRVPFYLNTVACWSFGDASLQRWAIDECLVRFFKYQLRNYVPDRTCLNLPDQLEWWWETPK